jgi:hypothetical protein
MEDREYDRMKDLINSGREYHNKNFILSGLFIALMFKSPDESIKLLVEVEFPVKLLYLFIYTLVTIFTSITISIYHSVSEHVNNDFKNQMPFNWIVFFNKNTKVFSLILIFSPWIICSIGIYYSPLYISKPSVILTALYIIFFIDYFKNFLYKIVNRIDENDSPLSLSIYMLYWYRILRNFLLIFTIGNGIIVYLNPTPYNDFYLKMPTIVLASLFILRIIGEFSHKHVDNLGKKIGFKK